MVEVDVHRTVKNGLFKGAYGIVAGGVGYMAVSQTNEAIGSDAPLVRFGIGVFAAVAIVYLAAYADLDGEPMRFAGTASAGAFAAAILELL